MEEIVPAEMTSGFLETMEIVVLKGHNDPKSIIVSIGKSLSNAAVSRAVVPKGCRLPAGQKAVVSYSTFTRDFHQYDSVPGLVYEAYC